MIFLYIYIIGLTVTIILTTIIALSNKPKFNFIEFLVVVATVLIWPIALTIMLYPLLTQKK